MLQMLHLDVSKVDRVLHMGWAWEAAGGVGNVRGGAGPPMVRSLANPTRYALVCSVRTCLDACAPDRRSGASKSDGFRVRTAFRNTCAQWCTQTCFIIHI
jgi:hypothetical protein